MTGSAICKRMVALAALLGGVYAVLAVRLACLHLGKTKPIERPSPYERVLPAKRGTIFDRNGDANPLAVVLPTRLFFVDPSRVPPDSRPAVAAELAALLGRERSELQGLLSLTRRRYVPLAYIADGTVIGAIQSNLLFKGCVGLQPTSLRHYPLGRQLCHVVGYVNREQVGVTGIELAYNGKLTGKPGRIVGEADANRQEIRERRREEIPPVDGCNIELTIDQTIQYHTEVALDRAMETHQATAAWAVVLRCRTGEVLAMASRPDADPANPGNNLEIWRNRAIAANYEPGSTFKALTVAAALNERLITTNSVVFCESGSWFYAGKTLRDKVRGMADITTILKKSSNVGAAKIALMMGDRCYEAYLKLAGFGQRTGIELMGEETGILDPARSWPKIKITRVAIGQGIAVTALQMASLYGAIANDGQRMRPQVVRRILSARGEVLKDFVPEPVHAPLFRPEIARKMRAMMEAVTQPGGTGTRAAIPGYRVAGKTGTAQMAVRGGYSSTDFIASFAGFLPAPDPEIVIVVAVERPHPLTGGGVVAAPVFAEIGLQTSRYLNILPSEPLVEPIPIEDFENFSAEGLEDLAP